MQCLATWSWQWPNESIGEADPLTNIPEISEELNINHSMVIRHLKQIGKVKKLNNGCLMSWPKKKKKIIILKCCLPLLRVTIVNHFTTGQWCMIKLDFIGQPVMTSSAVGLRRSSKAFPKAKLAPKNKNAKVTWWPAGGLLAVWSTTALRIQGKALHLRSILSTSVRYTENCNTCSQHWSTGRAQFFFMTMPDGTLHNHCFKSWMNWAAEFCLICHIHLTSCQLTDTFQESQQLFEVLSSLIVCNNNKPFVNWIVTFD